MSKNDVSSSTTTAPLFASKASALPARQSLFRRLTPHSPVPSMSTPFLKTSSLPPPSKTLAEKQPRCCHQAPPVKEKTQQHKPVSRLESVRLTLMASVSRRRARSTNEMPPQKQRKQLQKENSLPPSNSAFAAAKKVSSNNTNKKTVFSSSSRSTSCNIEGSRLSLYTPPSAPRLLLGRRPMSQFSGLTRIVEDNNDFVWQQGTSTATVASSDRCSTRSNSARSSSSSSIRTVSENNISSHTDKHSTVDNTSTTTTMTSTINNSKLLSKFTSRIIATTDPNKHPLEPPVAAPSPPPTPAVSFSSSLYPSRLRGIIKSATATEGMTTPSTKPMVTVRGAAESAEAHTTNILLTTPPNVQKKEDKAISVWRNTVLQMLSETPPVTRTSTAINDNNIPVSPLSSPGPNKCSRALSKFIMNELFTTEQSYQALLTLIQTRYMQPMMDMVNNPLVKETDIAVLFRHLPEMIALSNKLLALLETHAASLWRNSCPGQIAEIFDAIQDDLAVFVKYAVHYQTNLKSIRRACNNVLFIKIEQESLARRDTNRMGIADYLIAPFQRVPRYCLLVKDLIKHADRADPHQFEQLQATLKMLTGLTMAMDHVQKISR